MSQPSLPLLRNQGVQLLISRLDSQTTSLVSWISKALTLSSRGPPPPLRQPAHGGQQPQMRVDFSYPHRPFRLITCGYPIVRSYALDLFP